MPIRRPALKPVLVDRRAQTAAAFLTDGTSYATCRFSIGADGTAGSSSVALGGQLGPNNGLDVITGTVDATGRYSMIVGHVPEGANSVLIATDVAVETTASIADGYFMAWWPGFERIIQISASSADGQTLATFAPSNRSFRTVGLGDLLRGRQSPYVRGDREGRWFGRSNYQVEPCAANRDLVVTPFIPDLGPSRDAAPTGQVPSVKKGQDRSTYYLCGNTDFPAFSLRIFAGG